MLGWKIRRSLTVDCKPKSYNVVWGLGSHASFLDEIKKWDYSSRKNTREFTFLWWFSISFFPTGNFSAKNTIFHWVWTSYPSHHSHARNQSINRYFERLNNNRIPSYRQIEHVKFAGVPVDIIMFSRLWPGVCFTILKMKKTSPKMMKAEELLKRQITTVGFIKLKKKLFWSFLLFHTALWAFIAPKSEVCFDFIIFSFMNSTKTWSHDKTTFLAIFHGSASQINRSIWSKRNMIFSRTLQESAVVNRSLSFERWDLKLSFTNSIATNILCNMIAETARQLSF